MRSGTDLAPSLLVISMRNGSRPSSPVPPPCLPSRRRSHGVEYLAVAPPELAPLDGQAPLLPPPSRRERHTLALALLGAMLTRSRRMPVAFALPPLRAVERRAAERRVARVFGSAL